MRPEERLDTLGWRMRPRREDFMIIILLETLKMCVSDEAHGLIVFLTNGSSMDYPFACSKLLQYAKFKWRSRVKLLAVSLSVRYFTQFDRIFARFHLCL